MWYTSYCQQCGKPITHGPTDREFLMCSACELGITSSIPLIPEPVKELPRWEPSKAVFISDLGWYGGNG